MTQAIVTNYVTASNSKPARMWASCEAESIYVPYDHGLDAVDNHRIACETLLRILGWRGTYVSGGTSLGTVWVCVDMTHAVVV